MQKKGLNVLKSILNGHFLNICYDFSLIKKDVLLEIEYSQSNNLQWSLFRLLSAEKKRYINPPIGDYDCIRQISMKDLLDFYDRTYLKEPFKISIISDLSEELCSKTYEKCFQDLKIKKTLKKPIEERCVNRNTYLWNYKKGFGIYVKMPEGCFFNSSVTNRVIEDMSCMFLEDLIPRFLGMSTIAYCQKLRYSRTEQFLTIEVSQLDVRGITKLNDITLMKTLYNFFEFIENSITINDFFIIKSSYKKYITNYLPSFEDQIKDITNNLIFGDAIYKTNEYLRIVEMVKLEHILKKIHDWLC